jgi:hypothetical protein
MIPLKTFEKNCTIELVQRLFRGLYAKPVHSRTQNNRNPKNDTVRIPFLFLAINALKEEEMARTQHSHGF